MEDKDPERATKAKTDDEGLLTPGRIAILAGFFVIVLALLHGIVDPPNSFSEAIRRYNPGLAVTAATAVAIIAYVYYTHRSAQATERSAQATKLMAQVASAEMRREIADELTTLQEDLESLEKTLTAWAGNNFDDLDAGQQTSILLKSADQEDNLDEAKAVVQKLPPSLREELEPAVQSVESAEEAVADYRIASRPDRSAQQVKETVSEAKTLLGSTTLEISNLLSDLPSPEESSAP